MLAKAVRLFHTVKYLKLKQVVWRIIYFLPRFITPKKSYPEIKSISFICIVRVGITEDYDHFLFLNEKNQLSKVGWDNDLQSKLWRYNLHYFDCLNQVELTNIGVELQNNIINKWIIENPFGKGTGWEPYPTSLRIINWIKWHFKTNALSDEAKLSLWNQVKWLADRPEYHLLGNHLFINAKALMFACVFYGLDEYSTIYRKSIKILKEELREQFLEDGSHFELSPMYHSLAMVDLLDLYQLKSNLPSSFPIQEIQEKYLRGMDWFSYLSYENGELAHFNDCANGIAPTIKELEYFGKRLGLNWFLKSDIIFKHLKQSGFTVFKDDKIHLIADIGNIGPDYLPGHAHADSLSFELAINGYRVIVNSGTSEYGLSTERLRQRSTFAHSTIELDGKNSSEVWSGFRVARRAKIENILISEDDQAIEISACHNGYKRIFNNLFHERTWKILKNEIEIIDKVSGSNNLVVSRFFIHPKVQLEPAASGLLLFMNDLLIAIIKIPQEYSIKNSTYHDQFGISQPNQFVEIKGTTPFENSITICWA